MKKLLGIIMIADVAVLTSTQVIACGAGDGNLVGFGINLYSGTSNPNEQDVYSDQFNGQKNDDFSYKYNQMSEQLGLLALTVVNLNANNANSNLQERGIAFNPEMWQHHSLLEQKSVFENLAGKKDIWTNFYKNWSNADDSYFTKILLNPADASNQKLANAVNPAVIAENIHLNDDKYFNVGSNNDPNDYNIQNAKDNLISFAPVQNILKEINTFSDNQGSYLNWIHQFQASDKDPVPSVNQQARHILVPIGATYDATTGLLVDNGLTYQFTFVNNNNKFTFNATIKGLVARLDLGTYKHTVKINDKDTRDYWYQAWTWAGYDYWSPNSLKDLTTNNLSKKYFKLVSTNDANKYPFYVGCYSDNSNFTETVPNPNSSDNGIFINRSIVDKGYSYNDLSFEIDGNSIAQTTTN